MPGRTKQEVFRFVDELAIGKVNAGRRISEARQAKTLYCLKIALEYFNKPTNRLVVSDVEGFEKALSADKVKSVLKQKPYAYATKVDIRTALKVFLRWRLGEVKAIKLVGWLDTRSKQKTPDFLKESDIEKVFKKCRTGEQRFLVAVLFDSGARAGEFLNIRFEDIELPHDKSNQNFVRLTLREEYSKTKGRTISLYWKHSLEAVKEYLDERINEGIKAKDPVFKNTYDGMRMFLQRLGKKVLSRTVYPHLFRHSSATYYATKLNRQELCYRYGWKFSSNMPDVYISRAGMENKELDEKFTQTELGGLKDELARLQQEQKIKDDRVKKLEVQISTLLENFEVINEILLLKPSIEKVELAIRTRRGVGNELAT